MRAVERELAEIWCDILNLKRIRLDEDFFRLGGDSLDAVELICRIKKSWGKTVALESLTRAPTIASLAKLLGRSSSNEVHSNLVGLQTGGSKPPFFCVHGVGGEVIGFTNLVRHLPPNQPFYGIRSTAPDCQACKLPTLEAMAARYVDAIRSIQPSGPYYLGGYSFGGSVAYEMARQLDSQGEVVGLLAILDHTPPPVRYQVDLLSPSYYLQFIKNVPLWILDDLLRGDLAELKSRIRRRTRFMIRGLKERVACGLSEKSVSSEAERLFDLSRFPSGFRKSLEEHYGLLQSYVPMPYPGRVTLFRARTRPLFRLSGYDLGWKRLAQGGLRIIRVPGNHSSILKDPHVGLLAQKLDACLRAARHVAGNGVCRQPAQYAMQ